MVLRALRDWRGAGKRALLATVVRTWGSSPRPVGSIMALCEDGAVVGSVSGGCIEDDLIYQYSNGQDAKPSSLSSLEISKKPQLVKYGVTAEEANRFGLPCGGTLELLLEYDPNHSKLTELVTLLEHGDLVERSTAISDGTVILTVAKSPRELVLTGDRLINTFGPEYRMLIVGAGQMTEYLATMAIFSGFSVTVCDPREQYRGSWSVPGVHLSSEMPDDLIRSFNVDRRTCVVALTHDPKLDDLMLLEALETDAFYIGAIGSRKNNEARRARMIEHFDQTPETLARLRGPIGIYIGSKTPAEIAVSIMAEVLAVKNNVTLPRDMQVAQAKDGLMQKAGKPGVSSVHVIVLAAGKGERFTASGGTTHKLAAMIGDKTVLQHTIDAVVASGLPYHLVEADESRNGMGDSIAAGVAATPNADGWLILPGDLPMISPDTLLAVACAIDEESTVVVPSFENKRGHPVGFHASHGPALRALHGDRGAMAVVESASGSRTLKVLGVDDAGAVSDIDTVADLEALKMAYDLKLPETVPR